MKKKTNRKPTRNPQPADPYSGLDASVFDALWPTNADGTPLEIPEPKIPADLQADWDARMAARAKYSAELNERRAKGEKISPFLCY